jgi:hypothetical protein
MVHYEHIHYEMVQVYDVNLNVVHILAMYLNQQEVNYIDQFQDDIQVIEHDSKHQILFHLVLHNIN